MTAPAPQGVLATSVFVADEDGRPLEGARLPDHVATTVITLAELTLGVLAAGSADVRARRLATLDAIADMVVLAVDEDAARVWARLHAHLTETGGRVRAHDQWIAAVAAARDLPIVTRDDGFDPLDGVAGVEVIRV